MSVIALLNRRGGVDKATLTLGLADHLAAEHRRRVLLVDLDPQATLTLACLGDARWNQLDRSRLTIADLLDGSAAEAHTEPLQRVPGAAPITLIAGTPRLSDLDTEAWLVAQPPPSAEQDPHLALRDRLASVTAAYDYTLIVCPPALNLTALNGLALADGYLLLLAPTYAALNGVEQLSAQVELFARKLGHGIRRYGAVLHSVDPREPDAHGLIASLAQNPSLAPLWTSRIRAAAPPQGSTALTPSTLPNRWAELHRDLSSFALEFVRRVR